MMLIEILKMSCKSWFVKMAKLIKYIINGLTAYFIVRLAVQIKIKYHMLSRPRKRRASCMSLGNIVTRFA